MQTPGTPTPDRNRTRATVPIRGPRAAAIPTAAAHFCRVPVRAGAPESRDSPDPRQQRHPAVRVQQHAGAASVRQPLPGAHSTAAVRPAVLRRIVVRGSAGTQELRKAPPDPDHDDHHHHDYHARAGG